MDSSTYKILISVMKENIIATHFDPHACVMLVQSTTIGNNENKAIYDTVIDDKLVAFVI